MRENLTLLEKIHLGAHVVDQFLDPQLYGSGMHDLRCFDIYYDGPTAVVYEKAPKGLKKV